jgi:hypothetical protein
MIITNNEIGITMKNHYSSSTNSYDNQNLVISDNNEKDMDTFYIEDVITDGFCS